MSGRTLPASLSDIRVTAAIKRGEQEWQTERRLYRAMIDQVPDYLFVKDVDNRFMLANRALTVDVGAHPDELIGKTDYDIQPHKVAHKFFTDDQNVIRSGKPSLNIEEYVIDAAGEKQWLSTSKVPLHDDQGNVLGIIGISRNITDRKCAEDQIHFMALHDALTGLPNRTLLIDRLTQAILHAKRSGDHGALIFIDLDNFKPVNDILGHNAGDLLLKVVSERMLECVRSTDTVARLGGDEFVVLLADRMENPASLLRVLDKLRDAIAEPIEIEEQQLHVTCSMGLALFPEDGADSESILAHADLAMYQAKENGRNRYEFYQAGMIDGVAERRFLQNALRDAIAANDFGLAYQPQVELKTGRIFGVEALLRWNHPELGIIPPAKFIGLVEESGLIVPIGNWVLREACRQNKAWQDAGMPPITMCVNVSARQLKERHWAATVGQILQETGMNPEYLELELTESVLMRDIKPVVATMKELQLLGVRFAIDDFGAGYSSLGALKDLPMARLKIDKSFVDNLPNDPVNTHVTMAMIALGLKLNMKVIAKGVETAEQVAFLRNSDCNEIQGFYFSEPVGSDIIAEMLSKPSDQRVLDKQAC